MYLHVWVSLLPWLVLFATSSPNVINSTDTKIFGPLPNVCVSRISQLVTFFEPVYLTRTVKTRKCRLIIFCDTAYRIQRISRLERKRKTIYRMKAHCCPGYVKVLNKCISVTTPTPYPVTMPTAKAFINIQTSEKQKIDDGPLFTQPANGGPTKPSFANQTVTTVYSNDSLYPTLNEVPITSGNNHYTIIAIVICIVVAACIIAAIVVACRRKKKAGKSTSEIPGDKEVLSLPPNVRNNCWDLPEGLDTNVTGSEEENYYVSMNNGFNSDTPNVNKMLSTRGSRYRFADLEEGNSCNRPRTDTLYVLPDPQFRRGGVNSRRQTKGAAQNCGSSSSIYVNQRQGDSEEACAGNAASGGSCEDIYSEIKTSMNGAHSDQYYVAYEDIDRRNNTDVNGNSGGGGVAKGGSMELMELSKKEDMYQVPKSPTGYNKNGHTDDDDNKNNNNDGYSSMGGCRSKTCDSGIYVYLNSKEEEGDEVEGEQEEEETDLIYSVPYANRNNNNNNNNSLQYSEPQEKQQQQKPKPKANPRKERGGVVKSQVYQNAAFSVGRESECSDDTVLTNTSSSSPSSSSSSASSSPSSSPSSSSLQQWPKTETIYKNVPEISGNDKILYQDIENTKKEFHV